MNALDNLAKQALSDAGAQCGVCGDQPGDRICPDCERCYERYVAALRAAGWAPRAEVLNEGATAVAALDRKVHGIAADTIKDAWEEGRDTAADELRAIADEAMPSEPATPDTLPAWLRQRFTASGVSWENLDNDERQYWEHQAHAVRRAVARNGFKSAP